MPGNLSVQVEIHPKTDGSDTKAPPALTAELIVLKGCREFLLVSWLWEDSEQREEHGPTYAEQSLHSSFAGRRQPVGR